jgi:hypothetical protein
MTTLDTRPDFTADFIDGEVGEVHEIPANPHTWTALTFGAATVTSGAGLFWSMYTGQEHPQLAFVLLMVFLGLCTRSLMKWEQFAAETDPFHNQPKASAL